MVGGGGGGVPGFPTTSVPFMPSAAWPATVQRYATRAAVGKRTVIVSCWPGRRSRVFALPIGEVVERPAPVRDDEMDGSRGDLLPREHEPVVEHRHANRHGRRRLRAPDERERRGPAEQEQAERDGYEPKRRKSDVHWGCDSTTTAHAGTPEGSDCRPIRTSLVGEP